MDTKTLGIIANIIGTLLLVGQATSIKYIEIDIFWIIFINLFAYSVVPLIMMIIDQYLISGKKYAYSKAFTDIKLYPAPISDLIKRAMATVAYINLPMAIMMPIEGLIPSFVVIFSYLIMKEDINYKQIIGIALSFFGLIILNIKNFTNIEKSFDGKMVYAIIAGIIFVILHSFNFIYMKKYVKESDDQNTNAIEQLYYNNAIPFIFMCVMFLGTYFLKSKYSMCKDIVNFPKNNFGLMVKSFLITFVLFGVTQNILYFWSDTVLNGPIFGSLFSLQVIVGVMAGYIFFNEKINVYTVVGSLIVIAGIIAVTYYSKKDKDDKDDKYEYRFNRL